MVTRKHGIKNVKRGGMMPTPKWDNKFREVLLRFSAKEAEMMKILADFYKIDRPDCLIREIFLPALVDRIKTYKEKS